MQTAARAGSKDRHPIRAPGALGKPEPKRIECVTAVSKMCCALHALQLDATLAYWPRNILLAC